MPPAEPLTKPVAQRARAFAVSGLAALSAAFFAQSALADPPASTTSSPAASPPAAPAEDEPARPPPLPPLESKPSPWTRTLEVGGAFALVARPATGDALGGKSQIRYQAATGFALHLRWPIIKYLRIEAYYLDCHLPVTIPRGALGLASDVTSPPVETFVLGMRLSPSLTWGPITGWITAGAGWGRLEFQRMQVTTAGGPYELRERAASFLEIPVGFGVSWEIVKRWLSLDLQATAGFVTAQHGDAFLEAQTVEQPSGKIHDVGPLPVMDASLVQTIGFSLLL